RFVEDSARYAVVLRRRPCENRIRPHPGSSRSQATFQEDDPMRYCFGIVALIAVGVVQAQSPKVLLVRTPMPPPSWALLEREVLRASSEACREFFNKYFDERGYLQCVERWGGDDGPDDAIENCNDWPILHALGGSDEVRQSYLKAWEGHLRQYTQAKTTHVPFAK